MAQIGTTASKDRPAYTGGLIRLAATRGGTIASLWPKRRGKPKTTYQAFQQERLRAATATISATIEREYRPMAEAITEINNAHAGLGGSAAIRPEDLHTQRLISPRWVLVDQNGKRYYPINARMAASAWLDWLQPVTGGVATRTPDGWLATAKGAKGYKLTANIPFTPCHCAPDAYLAPLNEAAQTWPTNSQLQRRSNNASI